MSMKLLFLSLLMQVFVTTDVCGQKIRTVKGGIFYSESYSKFLDTIEVSDVINFVVIPDVFLPFKNKKKLLSVRSIKTEDLGKGLSLESKTRIDLRKLSDRYLNTNLKEDKNCYTDSVFCLVPVVIKYIIIDNVKHPLNCDFPVIINCLDNRFQFNYERRNLKIISLKRI